MSEEQLPQETPQPAPTPNPQPSYPPPHGGFPPPNAGHFGQGMQQSLPNATLVLVFGIISILTCCCFYGVISLILSIVALVVSKKDRALYAAYPQTYTASSYKNLNAGRVCAIIGLILSALLIISFVIAGFVLGWSVVTDQQAMKEFLESLQHN
ncbi:MAG: CCC motif membrane protein [Pedobacter sp.]|nr:CCC motif membrane protein [Pedobacter sp.]MDQ8053514.1 CCC motif membrane protein [Pedobacter sp.]